VKNPKIDDRTVDHEEIEKLLEGRDSARTGKNFRAADEFAETLQNKFGICYHDETKVWYTRAIKAVDTNKTKAIKTKRQLRNKRQAEKNRKKAKGTNGANEGDDDDQEDDDDDDEDKE
jgi:hypothetical protein